MADRKLTNSELHLQKLAEEEAATRPEDKGILEIFTPDEDEPLTREGPDESGIRGAR